ncbi:hypothetical protein MKX01_026607 [Papaver californicum]|nr:hypothetical protein MKX01_026607 [Papaver californicum]
MKQCIVNLRKNGLRLTWNKGVLVERIREDLGIINSGGEQKYPVSRFVYNCKGRPCGTRTVAGRIVKESYGSSKQQHAFMIEILMLLGLVRLKPEKMEGRRDSISCLGGVGEERNVIATFQKSFIQV